MINDTPTPQALRTGADLVDTIRVTSWDGHDFDATQVNFEVLCYAISGAPPRWSVRLYGRGHDGALLSADWTAGHPAAELPPKGWPHFPGWFITAGSDFIASYAEVHTIITEESRAAIREDRRRDWADEDAEYYAQLLGGDGR